MLKITAALLAAACLATASVGSLAPRRAAPPGSFNLYMIVVSKGGNSVAIHVETVGNFADKGACLTDGKGSQQIGSGGEANVLLYCAQAG